MNPVLADIYSTVIPSMPFIISSYALILDVLLIYVLVSISGLKKAEKQIAVLEEAVAELKGE
ncbi:hypothetical protein [uncultured Senegalimassilia sp.]|uniref:hypothetical protein n=1 Tax=uncultured Senegalimassilia sp. TaxID=1714350 RepID=UPI0025F3A499|nr:hypothetical protein [uncultured Senegalimassilia sp.]